MFQNNGTNFNNLSTANWSTIALDLAFQALLSAGNTGENHAQAQSGAFQLGNSYLSLLTDPFATNKITTTTGSLGYAAEKKLPAGVRAANAAFKALPPPVVYMPHWDVWGAAFGGVNNTRGDNVAGTSDLYTRVGGVAAGADYRFAPDALVGFSLAGGNINWSLNGANAIGGGSSDTFMAGIYGKYGLGAGYLSGAATYTNYWMKTDRVVLPGSRRPVPRELRCRELGWTSRRRLSCRPVLGDQLDALRCNPGPELQDSELFRNGCGWRGGWCAQCDGPDRNGVPRRGGPAVGQGLCRGQWQSAEPVRQIRLCP